MTSGTSASSLSDGTGIPRGGFGLHTLIELSSLQDYSLPGAPYQNFSAQVRRGANPEWNAPRHPTA